jgi:SAM-dependent methyltransferase
VVSLLCAIHANQPTSLREDFCGTGAVARRWIDEGARRDQVWRSVGVDLDQACLDHALLHTPPHHADRIRWLHADCIHAPPAPTDACDVIFVGNFSIGYIHTRADLLAYFRSCHRRLAMGNAGFGGGVLVFDLYGGPNAFALGSLERTHPGRGREIIKYLWRHEEADPRTAMVTNSISLRVLIDGDVVQDLPRAFVYRWRLWSLPELADALAETGFTDVQIYTDINIAPNQLARPIDGPDALQGDWVACIAARQA